MRSLRIASLLSLNSFFYGSADNGFSSLYVPLLEFFGNLFPMMFLYIEHFGIWSKVMPNVMFMLLCPFQHIFGRLMCHCCICTRVRKCVWMCVCAFVCECVCVCVSIYVHVCECVCVCVSACESKSLLKILMP